MSNATFSVPFYKLFTVGEHLTDFIALTPLCSTLPSK